MVNQTLAERKQQMHDIDIEGNVILKHMLQYSFSYLVLFITDCLVCLFRRTHLIKEVHKPTIEFF